MPSKKETLAAQDCTKYLNSYWQGEGQGKPGIGVLIKLIYIYIYLFKTFDYNI